MRDILAYKGNRAYIFVSYAHLDSESVLPVIGYLQKRGYNVWFDEGIDPGKNWEKTLQERISGCSCFLAFISENFTASEFCRAEVRSALDNGKDILSIFLDDAPVHESLREQLLSVQGIERYKLENDSRFFVKLLGMESLEKCHDQEDFQIEDGLLVRYNGTAADVIIPEDVTHISYDAFDGCRTVMHIYIPKTVDRIGKFAFADTPALHYIDVEPENAFFADEDGVLFNRAGNYLLCYPSARPYPEYAVSEGVKFVSIAAFSHCETLRSVTLPSSVSMLGDRAFEACNSLIDVRIEGSLDRIRPYTFARCSSLVSCELPDSVKSIGDGAFSGCSSLGSIDLPGSLERIGEMAFAHCGSLSSISIPHAVQEIPAYGFHECWNLESADIGEARVIGAYAFKNCEALCSIDLGKVDRIGRAAFSGCNSLEQVVIPAAVEKVEDYAFDRCTSLKRVVIEDGVRFIGSGAFEGDIALEEAVVPESIEDIAPDAFPAGVRLSRRSMPSGEAEPFGI